MKTMTCADLKQRVTSRTQPFILDVRQPEEFAEGHIEGAVLIPLGELPARLGELAAQREKEIVVNCRSGARSARACDFMERQGFKDVANLIGGILEWQK